MNRKASLIHSFLLLLLGLAGHASGFQPGFVNQLVSDGLDQPTAVAFAPDGRIFVSEKGGAIRIIEQGVLLAEPFLTLDVDVFGERGISSITLDPDFDSNGYIYVYYNVKHEDRNRIERYIANGNRAMPGSAHTLMNLNRLSSTIHNGGTMRFSDDGYLYVATGEGADPAQAQDIHSLLGKVLRILPDGSIPSDNPFYTATTGNARAVYATGFRNPFSMDLDPGSGRLFVCDVGLSDWEEVDEVLEGHNYGWPLIEGPRTTQSPPPAYRDPLYAYDHAEGCAVIGAVAYNYAATIYPPDMQNHLLFGDFCNGMIRRIDLQTNQLVDTFATGIAQLTNLVANPYTGELYYTEFGAGKLWRILYVGTGAPFISEQPRDVTATVGESVEFSVSAVAADSLQYQWFRDQQLLPGAEQAVLALATVSLADSGRQYHCRVFTATDTVGSDPAELSVTSNQRPVITIDLPLSGGWYQGGEEILYTGTATDPETGAIQPPHAKWRIDFHHDTHTHPVLPPTVIADTGRFVIPAIGETDTSVWYRIQLSAIDTWGLEGSGYVDLHPRIGTLQLRTVPSGLPLFVEGSPVETPARLRGVAGTRRTLTAAAQTVRNDSLFRFAGWEPAGGDTLQVSIPAEVARYTAHYEFVSTYDIGNGDGLLGEYWNATTQEGAPYHTQVDSIIEFRWEWGQLTQLPTWLLQWYFGSDTFAIRWSGDLLVPVSGWYEFHFQYDDRMRFFLGGEKLLDRWGGPAGQDSVRLLLRGGQRYPIRLDYTEHAFTSRMVFRWKTPFFERAVVPQAQLYSVPAGTGNPAPAYDQTLAFPVPLGPELYIFVHDHAGTDFGELEVEVFNLHGQRLKSALLPVATLHPAQLDIRDLPAGALYFIRIRHNGKVTVIPAPKWN